MGFLGVVIGLESIKIEQVKIKGVLDWLTLKKVKNIQKFLRLANYYQQFIKNFIAIARPLYNIVKKDQKWKWIERQKKAFQKFVIYQVYLSGKHISTVLLQYKSVDRLQVGLGLRQIQNRDNYQSIIDGEHITWKSCDRVQNGLEGSRGVQIKSQGQG